MKRKLKFEKTEINDEQAAIEMQIKLFQAFEYDGNIDHCFSGIIHHLTETCGGNVHDKGIVEVTASSASELDNLENYQQNSWLKYDFKEKKIHPTKYSIRSRHWAIEGSNSGGDDDNDITCLDDEYAEAVFVIQKKLSDTEFYHFFHIIWIKSIISIH